MEVPVSFTYQCSVAKKSVLITGTDGILKSDRGIEKRAVGTRSCNGSPACGFLLGHPGCPYASKSN